MWNGFKMKNRKPLHIWGHWYTWFPAPPVEHTGRVFCKAVWNCRKHWWSFHSFFLLSYRIFSADFFPRCQGMTFLNAQIGALFCFSSCWHAWVAWVCATQEWPVRGLCMNNYNSLVLFSWTVISFSLGFICCFQGDQGNSFSIVLFYQSLKWLCLPAWLCHHLVWFAVFLAKWFFPQYSQIML